MKNVLEFFKNLPQKKCTECAEVITEQSECYTTKCVDCLSKK